MIKLEEYIFNLEKLFSIENEIDKKFINGLFHELRDRINSNSPNFTFIFNKLYYGGFLVNKAQFDREKVFEALDV